MRGSFIGDASKVPLFGALLIDHTSTHVPLISIKIGFPVF
jgi:hypothetical protein